VTAFSISPTWRLGSYISVPMAAEPPPFSVEHEEREGRLYVVPRGELDLASAPELEELLVGPLASGSHVVLDLRELEFMDSSGVRTLVTAHGTAERANGTLSIVWAASGGPVDRVIEVSGLDGTLNLVEDPAEIG
jgi:anti-sigma B factor antagonist